MTTPPDWSSADKAYQLHHTGCATCRAAGTALVQGSGAQMAQLCGPSINRREIRRTSPGCAGRKEPVFQKPMVTVTPVLGQDLIGHDTDIYGRVSRQVANLQDQIVRNQLIAAGWTPPGPPCCDALSKAAKAVYMLRGLDSADLPLEENWPEVFKALGNALATQQQGTTP